MNSYARIVGNYGRNVLFSCPEDASPHLPEGTRIGKLRSIKGGMLDHGRIYGTPRAAKQAARWWHGVVTEALLKAEGATP